MFALNFQWPQNEELLIARKKDCTVRLGDIRDSYPENSVVWITVGPKYGPKRKLYNAMIDTAYTKETPGKEDDMMAMMRTQSTYMMPLMTIFIGFNFSVGILLYWFVNSAVMAGQQILITEIDKRKEGKV